MLINLSVGDHPSVENLISSGGIIEVHLEKWKIYNIIKWYGMWAQVYLFSIIHDI